MKKLLNILSLLFIVNISFAQVKVGSQGDVIATGIYPVVKSGAVKGGLHLFHTITERNALPTNFRDTGMLAYVIDSAKFYYLNNSINNTAWTEWQGSGGGGGSGCTTFYVTSDSLYFVRDSCGVLDSTQIVGDGSGGGGITQGQLDDTAQAIRDDFPTGSVQSVTGLNTDNTDPINPIVKVSVDGATITGLGTPASPLVATASGTALNGTGFVKMTGTTPSYVTSPIDSASYHTIVLPTGDSLLVFQKPNGQSDTVSFALLQYWKKNLNNIYYNGGNVGIGTDTPYSKLEIITDNVGANAPLDSNSLMIMNRTAVSSFVAGQYSGSVLFGSGGWDAVTSLPMGGRLRMYATAPSNVNPPGNHNYPSLVIDGSIDSGKTYASYATLSKREAGGLGALTVGSISTTLINSVNLFNTANLSTGLGSSSSTWSVGTQLSVGGTTRDSSASITQNSTNLGILPNRLTTAQRDAINMYVSSVTITNPGTGYTSPPTVAFAANASPINALSARATGTAVLSGSTVGSITITNSGYYNTPPAITFSGGGGTGAAATAVLTQRAIPDGLTIYCTDCTANDASVGVMQTYQISTSSWKNYW